ncbi:MAG: aromatic hydrocarbon degradation protein [Candidatus Marinimicrobia bacterium]|jgi:long-chain fatty acid transport protein|nr:aromatic hydrocarbon degradation protein [Candidatus Neomarinimicrobiota bacterium]MBT3634369.1 aromatic hydrocarbon degradation protein [Candidatus Neomarinimicrobiota bacterium]MBT3681722.1 aromatic hydrocarbon degradation protein [Candidatus Neomarinimicrobiota bacterium]MBT3759448.1 aromatic hydrocarbon degradation protein [Candidatus Neomarinimicrobiota bacterium]MBT3895936.1 aromatic hydrocarbon degradation protein [Candidatus Neomarinimicrobiota bacterium]
MNSVKKIIVTSFLIGSAFATNGMNLEGFGPIACGMGGASFAYNNGTAAVMNNPATLSLIPGGNQFDFSVGLLGPDVGATVMTPFGNMFNKSSGRAYYMPGFGYTRRYGKITTGISVFGQGGMGTEFGKNSWMADPSGGNNTSLTSGLINRSEVSVGRAILPLVYSVNEKLSFGGSFDYVWAGMDLKMALNETQFQDLANPMAQTIGNASGTLVDGFGMMYEPFGGAGIQSLHHAYFNFSDDSDFTGEAKGTGVAFKLGALYSLNEKLNIGATYHSKTSLDDLESDDAEMEMALFADPGAFTGSPTGTYMDIPLTLTGKIVVNDFQWPAIMGVGISYKPMEKLMIAADIKQIAWSDAMKNFSMTFSADNSDENGAFGGAIMDANLYQNWEDQTVIALGAEYQLFNSLALRAGYNYSENPVPDSYLNALFPATVESHLTAGCRYNIGSASEVNFSFSVVPEVKNTNPGNGSTMPAVESTHSQMNFSVMYTRSL